LALLAALTLLFLRVLLGAIAHALPERLEAAIDVAHPVLRLAERIFTLAVAERRLRILDALAQAIEIGRQLVFDLTDAAHVIGLAGHSGLQRVLRVAELLADPLVGHRARSF